MKTIKIIELFNKLVNKEEVPERIKVFNTEYHLVHKNTYLGNYDYQNDKGGYLVEHLNEYRYLTHYLNMEAEIIEEPKEIQPLNNEYVFDEEPYFDFDNYIYNMKEQVKIANKQGKKIDELVRAVNELKRGV